MRRAPPGSRSVFHLFCQKQRRQLHELLLGFADRQIPRDQCNAAAQVPARDDGLDCAGADMRRRGRDGQAAFAVGHLARRHGLFQLGRQRPAVDFAPYAAPRGDNAVAVADGAGVPAGFVHGFAHLGGKGAQLADRGILFKNNAAARVGKNFERLAFADAHGAADFFGDDNAPQVVLMCQVKHKKSVVHFFVIRLLYFTTFYLLFHRKNTEKFREAKKYNSPQIGTVHLNRGKGVLPCVKQHIKRMCFAQKRRMCTVIYADNFS